MLIRYWEEGLEQYCKSILDLPGELVGSAIRSELDKVWHTSVGAQDDPDLHGLAWHSPR